MCACVVCALCIGPSDLRWFPVPITQQAMMIFDESLLTKLCWPSLHVSECTRMHFKTPKIFWESMPPHLPRVKDCRAAMFSTSAYNPPPPPTQ